MIYFMDKPSRRELRQRAKEYVMLHGEISEKGFIEWLQIGGTQFNYSAALSAVIGEKRRFSRKRSSSKKCSVSNTTVDDMSFQGKKCSVSNTTVDDISFKDISVAFDDSTEVKQRKKKESKPDIEKTKSGPIKVRRLDEISRVDDKIFLPFMDDINCALKKFCQDMLELKQSKRYLQLDPVFIGLSGPDGCGKTSLVFNLCKELNSDLVEIDLSPSCLLSRSVADAVVRHLSNKILVLHLNLHKMNSKRYEDVDPEILTNAFKFSDSKSFLLVVCEFDMIINVPKRIQSLFSQVFTFATTNLEYRMKIASNCLVDKSKPAMLLELCKNTRYFELRNMLHLMDLVNIGTNVGDAIQRCKPVEMQHRNFIKETNISFQDIVGLEGVKEECTENFLKKIQQGHQPEGIILYGPPGCGKTMMASALAREAGQDFSFMEIRTADILGKFLGESEKNVIKYFELAERYAPAILYFDEMDALFTNRHDSDNSARSSITATLLTELDGVRKRKKVYVLGSTNRIEAIDEAFKRAGRFGKLIDVPLQDSSEFRRKLLLHSIMSVNGFDNRQVECLSNVIETIASRTQGWKSADIVSVVRDCPVLNEESLRETFLRDEARIKKQSFAKTMSSPSVFL